TLLVAGALAVILALICGAVFLTTRTVLFNQVDDALVARAEREHQPLLERLRQRVGGGQPVSGVAIGPAFTVGGYFYAVMAESGTVIGSTSNADPQGLPEQEVLARAVAEGPTFANTQSSEGEDLRVYLLPLQGVRDRHFLIAVGRSTEPE